MKNKVIARVKEVGPMRYEVGFEEVGDIWSWLKSNDNHIGNEILEKVRYNENKELNYEAGLNKYLRKLKEVRNIQIIDERKKATTPTA